MLAGFRAHICCLTFAVGVVLSARAAFKSMYAEQHRALQLRAFNERGQELARIWNALTYTNVTSDLVAEVFLSRVDWSSLQLTEIQEVQLKGRLGEVLGFLCSPDFGEYYRLKTEGLASSLKPSDIALRLFGESIDDDENSTDQQVRILRTLWEKATGGPMSSLRSEIIAISLDRVRAATSTVNSHQAILGGNVSNGLTVIVEAVEPGFRYGSETNAVSSESIQGLFFHLSFIARSNTSTNAGPVYLSLYWSESDQNWALSRLLTDRGLNFRTLF